ncbi:hypothetical protein EV644_1541 [Kribbella orskensis]|uniref:Uncharacterized protein n=1 Tax=Kribbella orskensis TaxID=2512216 RepID=A0ABY2B6D3_9ACTN|nr:MULTISPECIES: hypothetical protein [Kribbella]TCN27663.1 hypothetical protein EV642_1561 [Kribbella sp. VKM Ac-2500]TCO07579.1 hypothetical protein EV644_1541 [Kribbella orskensis]
MVEPGTAELPPASPLGKPAREPQQPREPDPPLTGIWTPERQSLRAALLKQDATIGGLYEMAVDGMDPAGWSMPRLVTVAHCVREICGALPHILGIDGLPPRSDTSAAGRELSRVWGEHLDELGASEEAAAVADDTAEPQQPKALVRRTVPDALVVAAAAYVVADVEGSRNARKVRGALVTGIVTENHANIATFARTQSFFMGYVHLSRPVRALPAHGAALAHFERVEIVLRARVEQFFKSLAAVETMLVAANRKRGDA